MGDRELPLSHTSLVFAAAVRREQRPSLEVLDEDVTSDRLARRAEVAALRDRPNFEWMVHTDIFHGHMEGGAPTVSTPSPSSTPPLSLSPSSTYRAVHRVAGCWDATLRACCAAIGSHHESVDAGSLEAAARGREFQSGGAAPPHPPQGAPWDPQNGSIVGGDPLRGALAGSSRPPGALTLSPRNFFLRPAISSSDPQFPLPISLSPLHSTWTRRP